MRILLLGKQGQLGWELERTLAPLGELIATDYPELDLSEPENVRVLVRDVHPQVIVNATAYTAVDQAENEQDVAMAINAIAPGIMAEEAHRIHAVLIHYSTDYVFDGSKGTPYTEMDEPNPINAYGRTKLAGEVAIKSAAEVYLIFRTSWVYSLRRDSFVTKVLKWARQNRKLRLVSDQVGNPTWSRMLAEVSAHLLAKGSKDIMDWAAERSGVYHLAGSGTASRLEWAKEILALDPHRSEQIVQEIRAAKTKDFPTPAQRPLISALDCEQFKKTFGFQLPDWRLALRLAMENS